MVWWSLRELELRLCKVSAWERFIVIGRESWVTFVHFTMNMSNTRKAIAKCAHLRWMMWLWWPSTQVKAWECPPDLLRARLPACWRIWLIAFVTHGFTIMERFGLVSGKDTELSYQVQGISIWPFPHYSNNDIRMCVYSWLLELVCNSEGSACHCLYV